MLLASALAAHAREVVDLESVLVADATGSIDDGEIPFQRRGHADALADPDVIAAVAGGGPGRIAVANVELGAASPQDVVVDWTVIDELEAARDFGARLMVAPRRARGRNAVGAALLHGVAKIETNDLADLRRAIDFSGDSANKWNGPPTKAGRRTALDADITVDGLALLRRDDGRAGSAELEAAFEARIVGGAGTFVVTVDRTEAFAEAVRHKPLQELQMSAAELRERGPGVLR